MVPNNFFLTLKPQTELTRNLENLQKQFKDGDGPLTVLSGVGISAESGIPTFRGQETYWSVKSRE